MSLFGGNRTLTTGSLITSGLVIHLDAGNSSSYAGSGTTWSDISGNGYNFTINATAYNAGGGTPYMDFGGAYGIAKYVSGGVLTNVPYYSSVTVVALTSLLQASADWRTLLRGLESLGGDHQIIVGNPATNVTGLMGMYDNGGVGEVMTGVSISSITNVHTAFNCLAWRLTAVSSNGTHYKFSVNGNSTVGSTLSSSAAYLRGFCAIGGYPGSMTTNPSDASQFWGKVAVFLYYNRELSDKELTNIYFYYKNRFGI